MVRSARATVDKHGNSHVLYRNSVTKTDWGQIRQLLADRNPSRVLTCFTLLLAPIALAETYNFPAKSNNLDAAYKADFFKAHRMTTELNPAYDAAACTGAALSDGSYLIGGNAAEAEGNHHGEGFATRLSATGDMVWAWKSGVVGQDGILSVAQLPNGEVLAAGYRLVGSIVKRSLTKMNKDTGAEIWTTTDFGDTASHGAWEMVNIDATHGVILTGLMEKPTPNEYAFKSGGNTAGGKAVVITMTIASLSDDAAPVLSDVETTKTYADYNTAHTAHFVNPTQVAALLWRDGGNLHSATIAVFNPLTGADFFTPVQHSSLIGEGTDMKLVGTTHAVISGHARDAALNVGFTGRLTKVSLADGSLTWSKEISSCGFGSTAVAGAPAAGQCSKGIIYNECWGVAVMADGGFALSCGTGIESCHGMTGQMLTDCNAGLGDKRTGAYPHFAGVWQSMTAKTDSSGTLEWQRVDSYKAPAWPALPVAPNLPKMTNPDTGQLETTMMSSAGEWAVAINNGTGIVIMTDQQTGIGLQKFIYNGTAGPSLPSVPTSAPTSAPPTDAASTPTAAPTTPAAPARIITQEVTITSMTLASYQGVLKRVYEAAYAISINIWDTTASAVKTGCAISSTAVAARRTGATITFTAHVNAANSEAAKTGAEAATKQVFINSITTANTALSASVTAPSTSSVTVATATVASSGGRASEDSGSSGAIVAVVATAMALGLLGVIAWYGYCSRPSSTDKMASGLKAESDTSV